ncbi:MAG: hypothetical protein RMK57_02930 [Bryobacterales bacterium]|nr:hypothetical protein [Bryobacteraceae bacterium]MDW8353462.1 hypothetical protein [Bryobacterales bacterium]
MKGPTNTGAMTRETPRAGFPLTLPVKSRGLPKESWIKIPRSGPFRLSVWEVAKKICRLREQEVNQAVEGLLELIA